MFGCLFGHWLADFGVYRWKSEEWKLVACSMHFYYGTFPFAASFWGLRSLQKWEGCNERVVQKKKKTWCEKRKRPSEVGDSGWAARNTLIVSLLDGFVEDRNKEVTPVLLSHLSPALVCKRTNKVECFLTPHFCPIMHFGVDLHA